MYLNVRQTAERWGISERRVRLLCAEGRISGAVRDGRSWLIPQEAVKPLDGRRRDLPTLVEQVHQKKAQLDELRPLTEGELDRLMLILRRLPRRDNRERHHYRVAVFEVGNESVGALVKPKEAVGREHEVLFGEI